MYLNEISRRFKKFVWLFFAHSNGDPGVQFGSHIQIPVCADGFTVSKCLMSGPAVRYLARFWALDQIVTPSHAASNCKSHRLSFHRFRVSGRRDHSEEL